MYTLLYSVVPSLEFLKRYDILFFGADVGDGTVGDDGGRGDGGGGGAIVFTIDLSLLLSIDSCLGRLV